MINLILFCFGTAGLTMFLDMCFEKGMIFRAYYNYITYWFYLPINKPRSAKIERATGKVLYKYPRYINNKKVWLWKILGGCSYCFGTWVFICTYLITIYFIKSVFSENSFILALYGFLGIGFNYVFIKLIDRI